MSLLDPRPSFSPAEYPQAILYWEQGQKSHWIHHEVAMSSDISDWLTKLNQTEKSVIGHILKGFTQSEVFIQEYWGQMVANWFKKPEIQSMAAVFSASESTHAYGYAYLNQSLGLEDFDAFLHEPTAKAKIDRLIHTKGKSKEDIALSLAIFSAFNEGVSLFSSFAILLNFSRFNKLKGIAQIINWSQKDECYSDDTEVLTPNGWKLFSELTSIDQVAQVDLATKDISFVKPSRIVSYDVDDTLIEFTSQKLAYRSKVTKNHRIPSRWDYSNVYTFDDARSVKLNTKRITPVAGFKKGGRDYLTPHERFLIATQADGHISGRYTGARSGTVPVTFSFSKERKIERLHKILLEVGYHYKFGPDSESSNPNQKSRTKFTVDVPVTSYLSKEFDWIDLSTVSSVWCGEFLEELECWDGHVPPPEKNSGKYKYYSSAIERNVSMVQAVGALCGKQVVKSIEEDSRSDNFSDMHRAYIHSRCEKRMGAIQKQEVPYKGKVYCVTVPSGAILVRYKDSVVVSGNCLHSEAGCWLFRTFIQEYPEIWTDELKSKIYDAARLTIQLEDDFIDKAFELGEIEGINPKQIKSFIRHRCNTKLADLTLKPNWRNLDKEILKEMEWFDVLSAGVSATDFFAQRPVEYVKGNQDFTNIWI